MRKVLVIAYAFPPMAVVGTYRTLKFVKFLREFGWEPVVLTLKNPRDLAFNPALARDIPEGVAVYRSRVLEPLVWWENLTGGKSVDQAAAGEFGSGSLTVQPTPARKPGPLGRLRATAAAALSTPDKAAGWILTALPKSLRVIRKEKISCLYTTSPPHSTHLIGYALRKLTGLPWLADFRDRWTQNEYFDDRKASAFFKNIEEKMELAVHRTASASVCTSKMGADGFRRKYAGLVGDKFHHILNGYDPSDFDAGDAVTYDRFTIVYVGGMYGRRNPLLFFEGLQSFLRKNPEARRNIQVKLIGVKDAALQEATGKYRLGDIVEAMGFLPQKEAFRYLFGADLLLLVLGFDPRGAGVIPAKLYEYLAAARPVLALVPDGETAAIIRQYDAGTAITEPDLQQVEQALERYYSNYQQEVAPAPSLKVADIKPFTRRHQAGQLAALLEAAVENQGRPDR